MAFDFNWLVNTLGATAGAGLTAAGGPLGGMLGQFAGPALTGLGDMLGITDSSSSTQQAMQDAQDALQMSDQLASFNAAGEEDLYANRSARLKAAQLVNTNSAEGLLNSNRMNALASQALGAADQNLKNLNLTTQQEMGNQRRSLLDSANAAGGSPAALAGVAGQLASGNTRTLSALQQGGTQAAAQGLQQAGALGANAEAIRNQDLATRLQLFQPYALQKSQNVGLGQLGGLGSLGSSIAQSNAMEDPLAALKGIIGAQSAESLRTSEGLNWTDINAAIKNGDFNYFRQGGFQRMPWGGPQWDRDPRLMPGYQPNYYLPAQ